MFLKQNIISEGPKILFSLSMHYILARKKFSDLFILFSWQYASKSTFKTSVQLLTYTGRIDIKVKLKVYCNKGNSIFMVFVILPGYQAMYMKSFSTFDLQ